MQLKTFTAPDVQSALRHVREELGPDAVIVSSRHLRARRGAFGLVAKGGVEITAAAEPDGAVATAPAAEPRGLGRLFGAKRAAKTYAVIGGEESEVATLGDAREEEDETPSKGESVLFYLQPLRDEIRALSETVSSMRERRPAPEPARDIAHMRGEIAELRHIVGQVGETVVQSKVTALPDPLRSLAMQLADAGIDMAIVREGLARIAEMLPADQLRDTDHVRECVHAELMRNITAAAPLERLDRRARVVALVGPTGVGKTTTAAKIAGQLLRDRPESRIALLTLDTYRVGAFDHLRLYADMIEVPAHVASTAEELDRLVRRHLDHDLVIIDTAGGNPKDRRLLGELQTLIAPNPLIETHLCVSATTKPRDLRDIGERFAPLAVEKVVVTKTDETNCGGSVYNFLTHIAKPLAYLTNGQSVPEDLEVASREGFCRWLMGDGRGDR